MGPYRLEYFIEKEIKDACKIVNLNKLVEQYKMETGREPVLLVDGNNFLHWINEKVPPSLLFGGQPRLFAEKVKNVVEEFQSLGLTLIFFFDGLTPEEMSDKRKIRNNTKIERIASIFNSLKKNMTVKELHILPLLISVCGRYILRFICNCTVKISLKNYIIEISEYAQKNGCFGILSQNTDFILRKGARYYLSLKHLDIQRKTTVFYDRYSFYQKMTMNYDEVVLLAAFMGQKDTSGTVLNKELKMSVFNKNGNTIETYKNKVKDLSRKYGTSLLNKTTEIANTIFPQNKGLAQMLETQIQLSLNEYKNFPTNVQPLYHREIHCKDILEIAYKNYINCNCLVDVYGIISGMSFENFVILEDMSKSSIMNIFLPMREDIYSLLLKEAPKSRKREIIEVGVWNGKYNEGRTVDVHSKFPSEIELGLLWTNNSPEIQRTRWKLFTSITFGSPFWEILAHIDMRYVVPLCVCKYIEKYINKTELEALLAQCVEVLNVDCKYLESIHPNPSVKIAELSSMFSCGVYHVLFLMSTCGLPLENAMPWLYFDGKILQEMYTKLELGVPYTHLFKNKVNVEEFLMLKYILSSPDDDSFSEVNTWGF